VFGIAGSGAVAGTQMTVTFPTRMTALAAECVALPPYDMSFPGTIFNLTIPGEARFASALPTADAMAPADTHSMGFSVVGAAPMPSDFSITYCSNSDEMSNAVMTVSCVVRHVDP
jgi:hypothetical protein